MIKAKVHYFLFGVHPMLKHGVSTNTSFISSVKQLRLIDNDHQIYISIFLPSSPRKDFFISSKVEFSIEKLV